MSASAASGWLEKHPGAGEDARPIATVSNGWLLAAVFDGMGGSGAKSYVRRSDGFSATGAAFAAQAAAAAVADAFAAFSAGSGGGGSFERRAEAAIRSAIEALPQQLETSSRVAGSLMLDFPTTACMLMLRAQGREGVALWVGDSLGFLWSGSAGLKLLTWADANAQAGLARLVRADGAWADAPNRMAISADTRRPWGFSAAPFDPAGADLLLVASDGAYGAFGGPLGFERALLDAVAGAASIEEACQALTRAIEPVKQDDASFAMLCPSGDWAGVVRAAQARRGALGSARLGPEFLHAVQARGPTLAPAAPAAPRRAAPSPASSSEELMNKTLGTVGWSIAGVASLLLVLTWFALSSQNASLKREVERLTEQVEELERQLRR